MATIFKIFARLPLVLMKPLCGPTLDSLIGDLEEEYACLADSNGEIGACGWYFKMCVLSVIWMLWICIRRFGQSLRRPFSKQSSRRIAVALRAFAGPATVAFTVFLFTPSLPSPIPSVTELAETSETALTSQTAIDSSVISNEGVVSVTATDYRFASYMQVPLGRVIYAGPADDPRDVIKASDSREEFMAAAVSVPQISLSSPFSSSNTIDEILKSTDGILITPGFGRTPISSNDDGKAVASDEPSVGPIEVARTEFEIGNYSKAVKTATEALAGYQRDGLLHYWALRSYYELRDYDNAIAHGEQAVKLDPQNAEYNRWLGRAYGGKAEQSHSFFLARKVKQAFETAVHLAPNNVPARGDLMQFLSDAPWIVGGDKQKAKEQVDAISRLDATEGHRARAAFFAADRKWKEAEAEYVMVVNANPRDLEAYLEAAEFFAERKNPQQLEHTLEAAKRVKPKDPRLDYFSAVLLILRGTELETAKKLLERYLANVPPRSDYPSHLAAQAWLSFIEAKH
jgi:tetratricopeptide (TPR) repeat protein